MFKQVHSDEHLIEIMIDYYNNIGFPTQRKFKATNCLPAYGVYYERFGSFKNAILISNIKIPEERRRYFDREKLTNNELLRLLDYYTKEKLKKDIYLLTNDNIDDIPNIPNAGVYASRFGGVLNAYTLIGINYNEFNNKSLEKDMVEKYVKLKTILSRVPNSRDLDEYCKDGLCYSMNAYENHFGGLYKLQTICGFTPTVQGRNKTDKNLIDDLLKLKSELGRIPKISDIDECEYMSSGSFYSKIFGSYYNALKICGFTDKEINKKAYYTKGGTKCFSQYEYKMALVLEKYNFKFTKDIEYYKDYIVGFDKKYRFDFVIEYESNRFFIEIFGIEGNQKYNEKTYEKIKLCKDNNLKLIDYYPSDLFHIKHKDLLNSLMIKIKSLII